MKDEKVVMATKVSGQVRSLLTIYAVKVGKSVSQVTEDALVEHMRRHLGHEEDSHGDS